MQLESEVLRLADQLKVETTSANALKRQLLQYADIAERYRDSGRDSNVEPGMEEVLGAIGHLFGSQGNPTVRIEGTAGCWGPSNAFYYYRLMPLTVGKSPILEALQ